MRAYLGRWAIGMTSSEEYVRTARQVVYKIQHAVNRSIVESHEEEYFEDEAITSLCQTAENSGANPMRIKKRHSVMMAITGRTCLGMQHPTLEVRDDDWVDIDDGAAVENAELEFFSVQRHVASARSFNSYSSLLHMRLTI